MSECAIQNFTGQRFATYHDESGTPLIRRLASHPGAPSADGTISNPIWATREMPAEMSQAFLKQAPTISASSTGSYFTTYDIPPSFDGPEHRTQTIDYVLVLQGTIKLTTGDGSSTILHEGDTVVQLGTMHKWTNMGDGWARMVTVMLPAESLVIQGETLQPVWPYDWA